jgi:hypothetical protein
MGTNYYHVIKSNECDKCKRVDIEELHVGKSSAGWRFSFHGSDQIRSYEDWIRRLSSGGIIRDEYGNEISLLAFIRLVESKRKEKEDRPSFPENWLDSDGNHFTGREFS